MYIGEVVIEILPVFIQRLIHLYRIKNPFIGLIYSPIITTFYLILYFIQAIVYMNVPASGNVSIGF